MPGQKKRPSRKAPPPEQGWLRQTLSKVETIKGLLVFLTLLGAFVAGAWGGLVKVGWDPVGSAALAAVEERVTDNIKKLQRVIANVQIEGLERDIARMGWQERPDREASLHSVELQLSQNPNEDMRKFLIQRKVDLNAQIKAIDTRTHDARERITKLKDQL